jgi:hypothetical protein
MHFYKKINAQVLTMTAFLMCSLFVQQAPTVSTTMRQFAFQLVTLIATALAVVLTHLIQC